MIRFFTSISIFERVVLITIRPRPNPMRQFVRTHKPINIKRHRENYCQRAFCSRRPVNSFNAITTTYFVLKYWS